MIASVPVYNFPITSQNKAQLCANCVHIVRAKFFRGNDNIYPRFMSFLHIDMTQLVEIPLEVRQDCTYST